MVRGAAELGDHDVRAFLDDQLAAALARGSRARSGCPSSRSAGTPPPRARGARRRGARARGRSGSSRSCSSPTSAVAIASRIAGVGLVAVSERRSITARRRLAFGSCRTTIPTLCRPTCPSRGRRRRRSPDRCRAPARDTRLDAGAGRRRRPRRPLRLSPHRSPGQAALPRLGRHPRRARVHAAVVRFPRPPGRARRARCSANRRRLDADARRAGRVRGAEPHAVCR